MTDAARRSREGFTLVEVIVALAIFALISAAGVVVLGQVVDARMGIKDRTRQITDLQRTVAIMKADVAQSTARRTRGPSGRPMPVAMSGARLAGDPVLSLTRAGWTNPDGDARASLQKVEYRLEGDVLERRIYRALDGARIGPPQVLYRGVSDLQVSFVSGQSEGPGYLASSDNPLPDAVRVRMNMQGIGIVEQLLLVEGA